MNIQIRNEQPSDFRKVEELTREAFWNLYVPGCDEHYLVHVLRNHADFIPELDFVAIVDDKIVGNIMYTKAHLLDENNEKMEIISFGPVSVLPEYQRKGIGFALIQHSIKEAIKLGHKAIVIYGTPHNYCKHGFVSSKSLNISDASGKYPYSLLALELEKDILKGHQWKINLSDAYNIDAKEAEKFDALFPKKEKEFKPSQEAFKIEIQAYLI
jgi:predicted N-acetyltransferase YhbS